MLNDQQLIELLRTRDKEAISVLYDKYSAALYGVVCRIVRSEAIAQDVLQDAFLKIWNNATKYDRSKGTIFTWMLNITRNTAIDKTRSAHFRYNGKIRPIEDFVNKSEAGLSHEFSTNHIGIRKKIEILDEKYKTIIDLVYFNGYTQQEVAEQLKLPLGTVKSRIRIALRELKKALSDRSILRQTST